MQNIISFLGLGSVFGISIALALGLEWLSLRALMHLMPATRTVAPIAVHADPVRDGARGYLDRKRGVLRSGTVLAHVKMPG